MRVITKELDDMDTKIEVNELCLHNTDTSTFHTTLYIRCEADNYANGIKAVFLQTLSTSSVELKGFRVKC